MASVALYALDDPDPLPPWVPPSRSALDLPGNGAVPDAVVDTVYRMARHASSLTEDWYRGRLELGISAVAYVELVGVVVTVAAVDGFFRAIGRLRPALPPTVPGAPDGRHPDVEAATLNWVPVTPPADREAAVVQALSAAPAESAMLWQLAAAQYIPMDEMGDRSWNRGTLSRPEMELVASGLSTARQCFY